MMLRPGTFDLSLLIPLLEQEFDEGGVRDDYYMPFAITPLPQEETADWSE
jgi:hypothetical protein